MNTFTAQIRSSSITEHFFSNKVSP